MRVRVCFSIAVALLAASAALAAEPAVPAMERVPERRAGEGAGPYPKLVIRGAMLIDGSGAPPRGPVDIVVAGNRIVSVGVVGTPGLPLEGNREPRDAAREIDASGMYVMPGMVDVHGHNGDPAKAPNASYGYKLWLAHGVTTVRGVGFDGGPADTSLDDKRRSAANRIVAPRLFAYAVLGDVWGAGAVETPEQARAWVRWAAKAGYDGIKLFNVQPKPVTAAALDEAGKLGLGSVAHLGQSGVGEVNARVAGQLGMGTVTHFYGHFESLLSGGALPRYPAGYNMVYEQDRFFEVTQLAD
ncbi:MAG: amidohydrolase, partial [Sphingomicrobium sp.]